jgi:hypothetical protein
VTLQVQPSAGRYFPIGPSGLISLTRDWPLRGLAGSQPRRLCNPRRTEITPERIAVLRPGLDVTVYSLPIDLDPQFGEQAVTKALELLGRWKGEPAEEMNDRSRQIVVSLHDRSQLRVLDERLKLARRKFGAGEGLSGSRKPRVTSRSVTELATLDLG